MKFYTNVNRRGNYIYYTGYDDVGKRIVGKDWYKPSLFVRAGKATNYKTLYDQSVERVQFESIKEANDFKRSYPNEVFGMDRYEYAWISDNFKEDIDFNSDYIKIANYDIETEFTDVFPDPNYANHKITAITITFDRGKTYHVFSYNDFINENENVTYYKCQDESELLLDFLDLWENESPDVISGWNSSGFDNPYIINRMKKVIGEDYKRLSCFRIINERERNGSIEYDIFGVSDMDYMRMYKTFTYKNQESYSLNNIAFVELGEKKVDYSEYKNLMYLYDNNFQKFIEYNIKDVQLVQRIDDKKCLFDMIFGLSYDSKMNYVDSFAQVRTWDVICFNQLRKNNIVVPPLNPSNKNDRYEGGFVKEPKPGFYDWVVSFDLNSLYPSIIMQSNISPETMLDNVYTMSVQHFLNGDNLDIQSHETICPNGQKFTTNKEGFIPNILKTFYDQRRIYKDMSIQYKKEGNKKLAEKYNVLQLCRKINLNSCYGALGNEYFRFYDVKMAEAVTKMGQYVIQYYAKRINEFLNKVFKTTDVEYVIYVDTDSCYIQFGDKVSKDDVKKSCERIDLFCEKYMSKVLQEISNEIMKYCHGYENRMVMKRENIAERGIWIAKKKYILKVLNSEGVDYIDSPKYKVMGIESIKSSTPFVVRKKLGEMYEIILNSTENELREHVNRYKDEFMKMQPEEIAFPRGITDIDKFVDKRSLYKKGTPIHVRASIMYNEIIRKLGLVEYQKIKNGDKIKFIYLKKPNPTKENIIAFKEVLPKEFNIHKYIDYETQFQKVFVDPIMIMLNAIGWNLVDINTLNDLFT